MVHYYTPSRKGKMKELLKEILNQQKEILLRLSAIEKTISERSNFPAQPIENSLEIIVTKHLRNLGVPAHICGYSYLQTAIMMMVKDPNLKKSISTKLYPAVAKEYNTTKSRVDRSIGTAIEISWLRSSEEFTEKLFGFTVDSNKAKPTNAEYMATVADDIRIHFFP